MIKIDNSLLDEIGLGGLPEAEKSSFLKHVYETLEMRVGIRLADQMSNEQLDEFERYFEAKDDAGAFKWLETNFPNYKDIVQQEFDKLRAEVQQSAPQILAASQAQAANPGQAAAMPAAPPQMPPQALAPAPQTPQPQPAYNPAPTPAPMPQQPMPQAPAAQPYFPPAQPIQAQPPVQPAFSPPLQTPYAPPQSDFPAQQPPAGPGI